MKYGFILLLFFGCLTGYAQQPFCSVVSQPGEARRLPGARETEDSSTVLKIPVVVHVLHLKNPVGSMYNPTETAIREMLDYLNKALRAAGPSYPDSTQGGSDTRIEFVLAARDRQNKPFNGIERIDMSGNREYRDFMRVRRDLLLATMWDKFRYANIWIVNAIEGGSQGFAAAPEPASAPIFNYEGVVITAALFRPGNPILVHEAGHYLGLEHTWGVAFGTTCRPETTCESGGDYVCDTEPHFEKASCQLMGTVNPCTGMPYGNTLRNFMSYSDYQCLDRFTRGQVKRMRLTMTGLRPELVNNPLTLQSPVSLSELETFTLTPNPSQGHFSLRFIAPVSGNLSVVISNSFGQTIYRKIQRADRLREWPLTLVRPQAGIYFITVSEGSHKITRRALIR